MKKRFMAIILAFVMAICVFPISAFAEETDKVFTDEQADIIIEVNSQEEYDALVAQINAHRQRAEQLWEQALAQANKEESQVLTFSNADTPQLMRLGYTINTATTDLLYNLIYCTIKFAATYEVVENSYGSGRIDTLYDLDAYAVSGANSVEVRDSQGSIIDQGRTVSANYSLRVQSACRRFKR